MMQSFLTFKTVLALLASHEDDHLMTHEKLFTAVHFNMLFAMEAILVLAFHTMRVTWASDKCPGYRQMLIFLTVTSSMCQMHITLEM